MIVYHPTEQEIEWFFSQIGFLQIKILCFESLWTRQKGGNIYLFVNPLHQIIYEQFDIIYIFSNKE